MDLNPNTSTEKILSEALQELSFQNEDVSSNTEEMTTGDVKEFQAISTEELTTFSNGVMGHIIDLYKLKVNPRSEALTNVKNAHRHFCQGCVEKVAASIIEGLEASQKNISKNDATIAAVQFLRKINLRVADNVSIELFNKNGMKETMKNNVFGGLPASIISCVQKVTGEPDILENTLGQEIFPGLLATGVVYDTEEQHAGDMLSDHCGTTIGKLLEKSVERGPCSCMWSEEGKEVFEEDCKNVSRIISDTEEFEVSCDGIQHVFLEIDEDGISFSDKKATSKAALVTNPAPETCDKLDASDNTEGKSGFGSKEKGTADAAVVASSKIEEDSDCGVDDSSVSRAEESDSESEGEEDCGCGVDDSEEESDNGSEDEEDSDCGVDDASFNSEEKSDYGTDEDEKELHRRIHTENHHFRPSYIPREFIEDFRNTRLCLSLCKHLDIGCHIDSANKKSIFKCIVFLDKNANDKITIPQDDETAEESDVLVKINGEEHKITFDSHSQPSFSLGTTLYELFAYEMNNGGEVYFGDEWAEQEKTIKAMEEDYRYDQAIKQGLTKAAAIASNAFCGHKFSKPCGKLYMAINTTATPWPCVIRTPPVSEISRDSCYGSFTSFTIPLPSTFTGRSDSPSKEWRSILYSNLALDKLEASFEPQTRRMIDTKRSQQWSFTPRVSDTTVKVLGSVIKNHTSGDKANRSTGLLYCPTSASVSLCTNRFGVEARYDYALLLKLMSSVKTSLSKYMAEKCRPEMFAVLKKNKKMTDKTKELSATVFRYNNYISKLDSQLSNMSVLCTKYVKDFSE